MLHDFSHCYLKNIYNSEKEINNRICCLDITITKSNTLLYGIYRNPTTAHTVSHSYQVNHYKLNFQYFSFIHRL